MPPVQANFPPLNTRYTGCFEEAWLYLPDDLEILTASSERRPTSGPRTAAATSATTAHSEGSHGLSLELQRSALEIARHKRLGTGPYQPPEERAASLARFRAGMRVRILGTRACP